MASAEQLQIGLLEGRRNQIELLAENGRHLLDDRCNDALQLAHGLFHVVPLAGEVGIPLVDPLELLDSAHIDVPKAADLPFQLVDPAVGFLRALQLNALFHCGGVAELITLPQLIQDLLLLHAAGVQLLLQAGGFPLRVQQRVVALLQLLSHGGALLLQPQPGLLQFMQSVLALLDPQAQGSGLLCPAADFRLVRFNRGTIGRHALQPLLPVSCQVPAGLLHPLQGLRPGGTLCPQSCQGLLSFRHPGGQPVGIRLQVRLPRQLFLDSPPQGGRLGLLGVDLLLDLLTLLCIVLDSLGQGFLFAFQALAAGADTLQQDLTAFQLTLAAQYRVLSGPALALGHL